MVFLTDVENNLASMIVQCSATIPRNLLRTNSCESGSVSLSNLYAASEFISYFIDFPIIVSGLK